MSTDTITTNHIPDVTKMVAPLCLSLPIDVDDFPEDQEDDVECERCHGDGADPLCDYLLPCPICQSEQQP